MVSRQSKKERTLMANKNYTTNLTQLLLQSMNTPDPMLHMLEWLCGQMMEAEVSAQVNAVRNEHSDVRQTYRSGYRPRRFDTRMGTVYLMVPKVRQGGYVPFFVTERKRSEAALIQVIQEAYIQGVTTRKMKKVAQSLGIESMSHGQVSQMAQGLNEQCEAWRNRDLSDHHYGVIWVDALYEKVRVDGRVISMAVMVVCGVDESGNRDIIAIEPMIEESKTTYLQLFEQLKSRGLKTPKLVISDAHKGLIAAIGEGFVGTSWQRCKVHFMRNILAHVPHKSKNIFASHLKEIWLAPDVKTAKKRAEELCEQYEKSFPKAIKTLENGLEDSLAFYHFPMIDHRKISSTNMLERLNREIRRRTNVVGIFPNPDAYCRLVTSYLMDYAEDWGTARAYIKAESMEKLLEIAA